MSDRLNALSGLLADRYVIGAEIGRGSSAIVYAARDEQTGKQVAIKLLRQELAHSLAEGRFATEVRRHQQLTHENVLPVLDFGDDNGRLFCVLPLMDEGTLRTRLSREHQLSVRDSLAIARSVALALGHAHEHGLVHRDVKPENILFSLGVTYLADFGIARDLQHPLGETSTTTGVVRGTGPYMSPEQAAGEKDYDGRSDLYSLGCVLYEMITGMQPFLGPTTQSVIAQRLIHAPRPMDVYRHGVEDGVELLVERAMALSPIDRFESAAQMAAALAETREMLGTPRSTPALTPTSSRTPSQTSALPVAPTPSRTRFWIATTIGLAALAFASPFAFRGLHTPDVQGAKADIPPGDPRRIAVLYLDDLSPESVPPYVVDGITEDLIDQLASVKGLRVISPNGVRPLRGRAVAPDSLGRLLSVGTVVSGSVARSGSTLRVNVRLTDARNNQLLQTIPVEIQWTEVFALQDTLADRVAFALRQKLGDEIARRTHRANTSSLSAWETAQAASEVLRGALEAGNIRADPRAPRLYLRADSLYAHVELLDPKWLYPTIRRGRIALALAYQNPAPRLPVDIDSTYPLSLNELHRRWARRAINIADAALRRAPGGAEAFALRGDSRYALLSLGVGDADSMAVGAERDIRTALNARPDIASAWSTLAKLAIYQGHFAEAATAARQAFDRDAYFEARRTVSTAFFASLRAEQFADARRWCQFGLRHYAGDPRFMECDLTLFGWTGRTVADAESAWSSLRRIEQRDSAHLLASTWHYRRLMVAAVLARVGKQDSARAVLRQIVARQASDSTLQPQALAEGYVRLLLGDREAALTGIATRLREAPQERAEIAAMSWFRELHGDPRFNALLRSPR